MKPVVGLTTYREQARWGVWDVPADLLASEYAAAVELAGGAPVLLPPQDPEGAGSVVSRLDGLVVSGGADVDPGRYAEQPHPRTANWRPDRDAWELALVAAADAVGLPVLGICRGMQLMAVGAGGELDQHTPDLVGDDRHSPGGDEFGTLRVMVAEGSRLRALLGDEVTATCHHHQSVRSHPGYVASARADDGTVEAMERPGGRFCVGVQWHPERGRDIDLFRGLVDAGRRHADDVGTARRGSRPA